MADEIKIPIRVEGGDQAEQQLKDVGDAVEGVGTAGRKSSEGLGAASGAADSAARKHDRAGKAAKNFSERAREMDFTARRFASQMLGAVNPALGAMFDIAQRGIRSLSGISAQLLGIVGAGAALGGIALLFSKIADAAEEARARIERIRQEQRNLRDEAGDVGRSLADQLAGAGIFGARGAAERDVSALQQRFERDTAIFGAVARQVGAARGRPLSDEDVQAAIAGFLVGGREARFTGAPTDLATLEQLITAGATPEAQAALAGRQRDVRTDVQREKIPRRAFDRRERDLDALGEALRREHGISEEEARRVRRLLSGESVESVFSDSLNVFELANIAGETFLGQNREAEVIRAVRGEFVEGGTTPIGELIEIARDPLNDAALEGVKSIPEGFDLFAERGARLRARPQFIQRVEIKVQNVANQYNQGEREAREPAQLEFAQEVLSP